MNNKKIYNKDKDNENYDNFENKYNEMHKYNHKLLKTITKLKII